jgi:hypothetical protein
MVREWAATRQDPVGWAKALWSVVHIKGTNGTSLPFIAFPAEIAGLVAGAERPMPKRLAIVGLKHHAFGDALEGFDGSVFSVEFAQRVLDGQLRMVAHVDGQSLGVLSRETPLPTAGVYDMTLFNEGQVVYAA